MLTLGLCLLLSGNGLIGAMFSSSEDGESVYLLCSGPYGDILLARSTAELIAGRGGAGYMLSDGENFELVYAVYPDKSEAESVLSSLADSGAYLKRVDIKKGKLNWADGELKRATQAALKYYRVAFDEMYACANKLNSDEMTVTDVKIKIDVLRAQIEDIKRAFWQIADDSENGKATSVKVAIVTALALIDNLTLDGTRANASSSLRYALVQLSLSRQALMEEI